MTGRTKLPNPRRRGEPITLDWIRSNCRVEVTAVPMTECWTWLGCVSAKGYGHVQSMRRRMAVTHRESYGLAFGDIDNGMQVDHVCRNRACCNPAHLDMVSARENTLRGTAAGIARKADPKCRVCGGTRLESRGPGHSGTGKHFPYRCADCKSRLKREWRARKRMEATLA